MVILWKMPNTRFSLCLSGLFLTFVSISIVSAQPVGSNPSILNGQDTTRRPIITAVPFLNITPDARAGAMGDAGVATSPDANAAYWNPAKLAFLDENRYGVSLSVNPWLRNLVNDMYLFYLSGYYKVDKLQAFSVDLRYFDMGSIQFTDVNGTTIGDFRPSEMAVGATYSRKLANTFSVAVGGRFIYSNLVGNLNDARPGISGAADIAFYYTNNKLKINGELPATLSFGLNISNIGPKISYLNSSTADFLPTNMRLGTALITALDPFSKNKLTLALDFNKLMVPTPRAGEDVRTIPLLRGMFGSFTDAPGGMREELREITTSVGAEYSYNDVFFARAGYFLENRDKGNRRYLSLGAGIRYNNLQFDFAYLLPPQSSINPLANTLRFAIQVIVPRKKPQTESIEGIDTNQ